MAIGTAGYTAMLAVMALERARRCAGARRGGRDRRCRRCRLGRDRAPGQARLSRSSPRPAGRQEADYLKGLGAAEVIERKELAGPPRPLGKERWAGAIDAVGSTTLANVLSMTRYGGAVAACGLAGGMDLPTSVAPFILRGVSLIGIDSVMCPLTLRQRGLAPPGNRPRPGQDRGHDRGNRAWGSHRRRSAHRRRRGAWAYCG